MAWKFKIDNIFALMSCGLLVAGIGLVVRQGVHSDRLGKLNASKNLALGMTYLGSEDYGHQTNFARLYSEIYDARIMVNADDGFAVLDASGANKSVCQHLIGEQVESGFIRSVVVNGFSIQDLPAISKATLQARCHSGTNSVLLYYIPDPMLHGKAA